MNFSKLSLSVLLACFVALLSFHTEANAQNAKFGNGSNCDIKVLFGVNDGNNGTYTIGPVLIPQGTTFYFTLPAGHFVYKIRFNNVTFLPPAPGTCVATGMRCPVRLCTDSPSSWYVL